jgi:hypothetical protein
MDEYLNTEKWEQWTADGGLLECKDVELAAKIPVNIGCGVHEDRGDGKLWVSTREYGGRDKKYLKTITLQISSWRGISAGAVHFYGHLQAHGVYFVCEGEKNTYSSFGHGVPKYLQNIKIEITRPVTQAMIDADPEMWEYYRDGSTTDRFDTVEEIVERGKTVFKQWFGQGWKLVLEKDWSSKKEVLKR